MGQLRCVNYSRGRGRGKGREARRARWRRAAGGRAARESRATRPALRAGAALRAQVLSGLWAGFLLLGFTLLHRLVSTREAERAKLLKA